LIPSLPIGRRNEAHWESHEARDLRVVKKGDQPIRLTRLPLAPESARSEAALPELYVKGLSTPALLEDVELDVLDVLEVVVLGGVPLDAVGLNV
jgi:hypothetical protein